jgi:hypothetical protein
MTILTILILRKVGRRQKSGLDLHIRTIYFFLGFLNTIRVEKVIVKEIHEVKVKAFTQEEKPRKWLQRLARLLP